MKLGFSTLGCPGWTLERAVAAAREHGYSGVELRLIDDQVISAELVAASKERLKRAFAGSGVELVCLGSSARFSSPDQAERAQSEKEVLGLLPVAKELGVPFIRVFGGRKPEGVGVEQGVENVAAGLNRLAPAAEEAGVAIVLETHDDFSSSKVVADVLARVPSKAVGALWDTHHPYRMGESVEQVWTLLGDRLLHTHVKDARRAGDDKWDLVLMGEGEVPVREILKTLKLRGWEGHVVVEWEKKWHPEIPDPEIAFPQHARVLSEYLA